MLRSFMSGSGRDGPHILQAYGTVPLVPQLTGHKECAMKTFRTALLTFAALAGLTSFVTSTQSSYAGGLGLDWLSNKPYVECLKNVRMLADVGSILKGPADREASYERGRHQCNQRYYGHE
jgi:hypothetical protein